MSGRWGPFPDATRPRVSRGSVEESSVRRSEGTLGAAEARGKKPAWNPPGGGYSRGRGEKQHVGVSVCGSQIACDTPDVILSARSPIHFISLTSPSASPRRETISFINTHIYIYIHM